MTIHVFIAHMGIGGAERVCVNLANEWAAKGHEVHIVTLNLDDDINKQNLSEGISVHTLGVSRLRYSFIPMYRYIRRFRPRFMFVFGNEMAVIIQKLRSLHLVNTPLIVRVLNNVNISLAKEDGVSPVVEEYLKRAQKNLGAMEHVVAQCEAMGDQLKNKGLVSPEHLSVIYNPVSRDLCEKVRALRADTIADTGRKREITFIGRIDPQKNPLDLLTAFHKLCMMRGDRSMAAASGSSAGEDETKERGDLILRFVGDGALREAVADKAAKLGISDRVIFDGIRRDMEKVYAAADVVALSSDYEGMPNCLIEAIGCGIPVVSYDCPIGPAEIVKDGVNGYLVSKDDTDALADALSKALDKDWDIDAVIATCDKFDVGNIADRYLDLFKDY